MTDCSEIELLLGAFEDGELEPNEMQSVAFHLARCEACTRTLSAYSALGRELRAATPVPELPGFSMAVIARIDNLPNPLSARIARFFGRGADFIGSQIAWGSAAAAVAILTVVLATPYAERLASRNAPTRAEVAALADRSAIVPNPQDVAATDSHAVISRLESQTPSVAVWSEPRSDTTVIWLPDQN
jgi:anti-sigma factor RsiW